MIEDSRFDRREGHNITWERREGKTGEEQNEVEKQNNGKKRNIQNYICKYVPSENVCGTVENMMSSYKVHSKVPAKPCIVVVSDAMNDALRNRELSTKFEGSLLGCENCHSNT